MKYSDFQFSVPVEPTLHPTFPIMQLKGTVQGTIKALEAVEDDFLYKTESCLFSFSAWRKAVVRTHLILQNHNLVFFFFNIYIYI